MKIKLFFTKVNHKFKSNCFGIQVSLLLLIPFALLFNHPSSHANGTVYSKLNTLQSNLITSIKNTSTTGIPIGSNTNTFYTPGIDYDKNTQVIYTIKLPTSLQDGKITVLCINVNSKKSIYSYTTSDVATLTDGFTVNETGKYKISIFYNNKNVTDQVIINYDQQVTVDFDTNQSSSSDIILLDDSE